MKWIISTDGIDMTGRLYRNKPEAEEHREHLLRNRKMNGFCTDKLEKSVVLPINLSNRFDVSFAFNEDMRRNKPVNTMKVYNQAMLEKRDKWDRITYKKQFLGHLK